MSHTMLVRAVTLLVVAAPLRAQAPSQILHEQFSVMAADSGWTSTAITVVPGDVLLVEAEGRIMAGGLFRNISPDGGAGGTGALWLVIGSGAGERVGSHAFLRAAVAGPVRVRIADRRHDDNTGSFTVRIIHVPAALIPPPKVIAAPEN